MGFFHRVLVTGLLLSAVVGAQPIAVIPATVLPADEATVAKEATARRAPESTAPSSLEAWRRGRSPATPASSPLKEIYFDFDSYDLRPDARDTLQTNTAWLKASPAVRWRSKVTRTSGGPMNTTWRSVPSGPRLPKITWRRWGSRQGDF